MNIEQIQIADLRHDPKNRRTHDKRNIEAIKESLEQFGQQKPIVVDAKGKVIAGNGTLEAAAQLGWEQIAIVRTKLRGRKQREFAIADNRTGELAGWDLDGLLQDLRLPDFSVPGFGEADIKRLTREAMSAIGNLEDDPGAVEPPADPKTKPGDIWKLGRHRLMCGDATKRDEVGQLLNGKRPCLVFTDPPYGVQFGRGTTKARQILGDLTQSAIPISFAVMVDVVTNDARFYFCGGHENMLMWWRLFDHHLGQQPKIIIWNKVNFVLRHHGYHSQYEMIYWGWKGTGGKIWFGDRKQSDVWEQPAPRNRVHPTEKPIELPAKAITHSAEPDGIVMDPFAGSGATLIAAEQLGRECCAMDLDPKWCDATIARWEQLTGSKAKRA